MTVVRVIDFETTGEPPDAAVIEAGYCDVAQEPDMPIAPIEPWAARLVDPQRPISPEACGVHHIVDEDLLGADKWPVAEKWLIEGTYGVVADVYAAHVAKFERSLFDPPGSRWICTWKVAMRLAPRAPGWALQTLRYFVKLDLDRTLASPAHRAGPDAYVTAHLLRRMLAKMTVEEMIAVSAEPALLPRLTFGKHKGLDWDQVPLDYLDWIIDKSEMDEDVKFTARTWRARAYA